MLLRYVKLLVAFGGVPGLSSVLTLAALLLFLLAACSQPEPTPAPTETLQPTETPTETPPPTNTPSPEPTATPTIIPSPTPPSPEALLSEAIEAAVNAGSVNFKMDGKSVISMPGFSVDIPIVAEGEAKWPGEFNQLVTMSVGPEAAEFEEIRFGEDIFLMMEPSKEFEKVAGGSFGGQLGSLADNGFSNPLFLFDVLAKELEQLELQGQEEYQNEPVYHVKGKLPPNNLSPIYLGDAQLFQISVLIGVEDRLIKQVSLEGFIEGSQTALFEDEDIGESTFEVEFSSDFSDYGMAVSIERPALRSAVFSHLASMGEVKYSPDGSYVGAITADPGIIIMEGDPADVQNPILVDQFSTFSGALAFDSSSRTVATTGDDLLNIWSLEDPPILQESITIFDELYNLEFSPDGTVLAGAGFNGLIYLWDTVDFGIAPLILEGHDDTISDLQFSPDGLQLVSTGFDGTLKIWNLDSPGVARTLVAEGPALNSAVYHPEEMTLFSAGNSGRIWQFDLANPVTEPVVIGRHRAEIIDLDLSSDGRYLVSSDFDGGVRLWAFSDGDLHSVELPGFAINVNGVRFSPDDQVVVGTGNDGNMRFWFVDQFLPDLRQDSPAVLEDVECQDPLGCVIVAPGEPIWLASALVISGANAELGLDSQRGVEIALDFREDILGHPLALQTEDDGCHAVGGQNAATKIISNPEIVAVVGTSCSGAAVPASEIISDAGYVMVSPSNTSPALTDPERAFYPGYLRTSHNDLLQGLVMADFAYNELGITKAAAIHDGDPYTEGLASEFANAFEELGGEIVAFEVEAHDSTNVDPLLSTIAMANPEMIYYPVFIPLGSLLTNTARSMEELDGVVLAAADGIMSPAFLDTTAGSAEGLYLSSPNLNYSNAFYLNEFLPAYQQTYGTDPSAPFHAHAFDATMMILEAIEATAQVQADGTLVIGRQSLRDALYATKGFPGITGVISCNEYGDCSEGRIVINEVQNGEFVRIWLE